MGWPSDTLTGVYLFLFAFGLIFSIASLVLGAVDLSGGEGDLSGGDGADAGSPSPLNFTTGLVFLTWFGAAGYVLRRFYDAAAAISLLAAVSAGLVGAALVYLFLAKVLWRGQTVLDPADYAVEGSPARISSPIRAGGTGEVVYTLDQKQLVAGARSVDGTPLPLGAEVEIVRYEQGVAYVRPLSNAALEGPFRGQPIDLPPPD